MSPGLSLNTRTSCLLILGFGDPGDPSGTRRDTLDVGRPKKNFVLSCCSACQQISSLRTVRVFQPRRRPLLCRRLFIVSTLIGFSPLTLLGVPVNRTAQPCSSLISGPFVRILPVIVRILAAHASFFAWPGGGRRRWRSWRSPRLPLSVWVGIWI